MHLLVRFHCACQPGIASGGWGVRAHLLGGVHVRRARMTIAATVSGTALSLRGSGVATAGTGPAPSARERTASTAAGAATP
ncbi:hypothetical protein GCM10022284_31920 [Streptomyces hundungensis]